MKYYEISWKEYDEFFNVYIPKTRTVPQSDVTGVLAKLAEQVHDDLVTGICVEAVERPWYPLP